MALRIANINHATYYRGYTTQLHMYIPTVQLNSNLTLACMSLAETRLIFKYAHVLGASA